MEKYQDRLVGWESHLVERARAGEKVAFELLADLHRPALFNLAMRMLRNADDAHDVVQEALVKAFRAIHDFQADRPLRPWLCRITTNCCVDAARHRKKDSVPIEQHEYALSDEGQDLESHATGNFEATVVREAVGRLPRKYREIIHMRHFRHMDVIEIAQELHKPEGTIKSWLFRARAMLRKDLQVALG